MTDPRIASMKADAKAHIAKARRITAQAEVQGRGLTNDERAEVELALELAGKRNREVEAIEQSGAAALGLGNMVSGNGGGLFGGLKANGWSPTNPAAVPFAALKTATFTGDTEDLNPSRREGVALGYDQRYIAGVFPQVAIDGSTTQVQVLRQASRTLAAPANVQRDIDATTNKAEVASARELVSIAVKQLAAVETGIPNIYLAQDGFGSMVNVDLRLSYLDALDDLVMDTINAANPAQSSLGVGLLEEVRYGMVDMQEDGYSPNVLVLSPSDAADFDLLRSSGPEQTFVFGPGSFAASPFGLRVVQSKSVVDPLLIDTSAAGRVYVGPVGLQTFEENAGRTNTSLVRLEGNAVFAVERLAAIREIVHGTS